METFVDFIKISNNFVSFKYFLGDVFNLSSFSSKFKLELIKLVKNAYFM